MQIQFVNTCAQFDQMAIQNAIISATTFTQSGLQAVQTNTNNIVRGNWAPYTRWFGAYSQDRLARVNVVLANVASKLNSNNTLTVTCDQAGALGDCERGDYAVVVINQRGDCGVTLCGAFFNAPPRGAYNTQWGVLAHEFTHASANTEDHSYSLTDAQNLAAGNPSQAVDNADNYEYFLEEMFHIG
jgi:peptidyl-Lys metalloendopeptidase